MALPVPGRAARSRADHGEKVVAPVSRNGTLLPIPPGSHLAYELEKATSAWKDGTWQTDWTPAKGRMMRSDWLGYIEEILHFEYPHSSSADRRLTARHAAPFPLRDGPNVP